MAKVLNSPNPTDLTGTNIASPIVPYKSTDTYPTHYEEYGQGGYRTVDSVEDRNAIPKLRRKKGMLVNVDGVGIFKLINDPTTETTQDADWGSLDSQDIVAVSPEDNGNLINLADGVLTSTDVTDDLPTYVFNVFLKANSQYTKIRWRLIIHNIKPTLSFITNVDGAPANTNAVMLLSDKDDLQVYYNTTRIFEFETWDAGATWYVSSKIFKNEATAEPREVITRKKLNESLAWEQL